MIWMILFFLGLVSIIEVYSASSNMSYKTGYYWKPILQHGSYFVIGVIATLLIHKIPCRYFKLIPLLGIPVSVVFLVVAMFTEKVNNASRWLEVAGVGFQPSELAKIVTIIISSSYLGRCLDKKLPITIDPRKNIVFIVCLVIAGFVEAQPDMGTAMIILGIPIALYFIAGLDKKWMGIICGVGAILLAFLFSIYHYQILCYEHDKLFFLFHTF